GQVVHDHLHIDAMSRAQVGGQKLQAILAPRGQYQVAAARGKLPGEFGTNAGGSAGDERTSPAFPPLPQRLHRWGRGLGRGGLLISGHGCVQESGKSRGLEYDGLKHYFRRSRFDSTPPPWLSSRAGMGWSAPGAARGWVATGRCTARARWR